MRWFHTFLSLLLCVWLAWPLAAPAHSTHPTGCHSSGVIPCLAAADRAKHHQAATPDATPCCHFYATTFHADVEMPLLATASAIHVAHEPGGKPQFIPQVATRPPAI